LPAMDNDDFRRGRPTNQKVYGAATAILAGASLALLGGVTVLSLPNVEAPRKLAAVRILFEAAGTRGVIAGQAMESTLAKPDLAEPEKSLAPLERLLEVFRLKTGALFKAALTLPLACDSTLTE